jgi:hypothetical protein
MLIHNKRLSGSAIKDIYGNNDTATLKEDMDAQSVQAKRNTLYRLLKN